MIVHEGVVWHVCLPVHSHGEQTTNLLGYKAFHALFRHVPRGSVSVGKHAKQPLHVQAKAPSIDQQNSSYK